VAQSPAIVYIDMAEDSLGMIGRWPWPRYNQAALVHILHKWNVNAIVFDVIFSEPSTTFDDSSLAEALKEAGNVYLPVMLEEVSGKKVWIHSLPELTQYAKGVGHVNIFPDRDGAMRRISPFLQQGAETFPYLAVKVAYDYLGKPLPSPDKLPFPVDSQKRMFVDWAGKWRDAFEHYSFVEVIKSYAAMQKGLPPSISPEKLKDKICLIGLTATGLTDIKANPLEETYPAVGVQANTINSILTNQFISPAPLLLNQIVLALIGFFASVFFFFSKRAFSFLVGLCLGVMWVAAAYLVFSKQGLWLYVMNPLLLIFSLFVFSAVFSLTVGKKEQERLFTLATRDGLTGLFVIRHFRSLLNEAVSQAHKKETPLSLLLLDLDHFKNINDRYGHVAGDLVLKHVAQCLKSVVETGNEKTVQRAVGRYGGEEFIVMLPQCALIDAVFNYGEKIRKKIEQDIIEYEGTKIPLTVSIGAATLRPGETVPDLMVHRADEALYRAKTEGRNRTCIEKDTAEG